MSHHLSGEQIVALLHGSLDPGVRAELKGHLAGCRACAEAVHKEAALDEVLWDVGKALHFAPPVPPPRRIGRWVAGGVAAATAGVAVGFAALGGTATAARTEHLDLLAWHNVIFYIPLIVGLLLIVGSTLGGQEHDHDHVIEHATEHGLVSKAIELLGVGRVPLTVVLMMATLLFGGTGVILNTVLVAAGVPGWLHPIFAVVGALVAMFFLTRTAVRLIQRAAPTHETYRVTRHDLAGCTGSLLFDADEKSGYAQIKDREGNVHNIKCRTAGEPLPKGTAILVVQYEEEQGTFVVSKSPV